MTEKSDVTGVYLSIYGRNFPYFGWSVGCEVKKGDITYFLYSLFLPSSDFKSKNEVLRYMIRTVLNDIDDTEDTIVFYSPLDHFNDFKRLNEIAEPHKRGRNVRFFRRWYLPITTRELESDAIERGYSVTERL
jgi:hypothetical protein